MPRTPLIAANLKMNPVPFATAKIQGGSPLLLDAYRSTKNVDVVIFPTFPDLQKCIDADLVTGAQYGRPEDAGAFTGDISMKMIRDLGCTYVLCGHSERRQYHHETNEDVAAQVVSAMKHGLHPILCVGENEEERRRGGEEEIVGQQLTAVLAAIISPTPTPTPTRNLTIAYEPIWAIGTGKTATPDDAQKMHSFIRSLIANHLPLTTRLLYGGSMKPENAKELLAEPDIDGGLIGGASLDPKKFAAIVVAASQRS